MHALLYLCNQHYEQSKQVKICGLLITIVEKEQYTDFSMYDGARTLTCRIWYAPTF